MSNDRLIQLACTFIAVVALVAAAVMIPWINDQRRELQLSYDPVVGDRVPPHIALMTTAAGSFRGILVDALWYRAEMQKRDGQYHEANTLAEAIVTLQPRFPQVWAFNAWNQAYNISVGTYTAEERWDWVSKGERMLRTRGIPYNPNSVLLYKELAWIWFHKIGGNTDDFHNYYKMQVARKWDELLGSPPPGVEIDRVLRWFEPIRDAGETYFVFNRPSWQMRQRLDVLAEAMPQLNDEWAAMRDMDVLRLRTALNRLDGRAGLFDSRTRPVFDELRQMVEDARRRSAADPLTLLYEQHPETRPLVDALVAAGFGVDDDNAARTVRTIGRIIGFFQASPFASEEQFAQWAMANLPAHDSAILGVMFDRSYDDAWRKLLPFIRARALVVTEHMDPGQMYSMMERYGPLDWRHAHSHALYFSRLGVNKSGILLDRTKVDILNTYRGIIHALQGLRNNGRVNYDPYTSRVTFMPDPRFIEPYLTAVVDGKDWITDTEGRIDWGTGVMNSFQAGHENFLQLAVVMEYLYGRESRARQYFQELRDTYGDSPQNIISGKYNLSMEQFVTVYFMDEGDLGEVNRSFVDGLIIQSFTRGLAQRRSDVFNRYLSIANAAHQRYNEMRASASTTAVTAEERLALPSLRDRMIPDAFVAFLSEPSMAFDVRTTAYDFAPTELQAMVYRRIRQNITSELREALAADPSSAGMDPAALFDRFFPRPPGLEDAPVAPDATDAERAGTTIERQ